MSGAGNLPANPDEWRAITLWQPWASLIAEGVKWIETRPRRCNWQGWTMIHAAQSDKAMRDIRRGAKSYRREDISFENRCDHHFGWSGWRWEDTWGSLPLGAVVAVARLTDCLPMVGMLEDQPTEGRWMTLYPPMRLTDGRPVVYGSEGEDWSDQLPYGDFSAGRYGLLLADVRKLTVPVPATGSQAVPWRVDQRLLDRVLAQVDAS